MRYFLLLLLLAFPSVPSQSQDMFAGYDEFCGIPVVVGNTNRIALALKDNTGRPYIYIDQAAMANWTVSRIFTLAHECGHHIQGHTSQMGLMIRTTKWGGTKIQELEADCWAARALNERGYNFDVHRMISEHAGQGHYSQGGYPSGVERARNISQCLEGGSVDDDYLNNNYREKICRTVNRQCNHKVKLHPNGDVHQCSHVCYNYYNQPVPCHPLGDLYPCTHYGLRHPNGHSEEVCE